MEWGIVDWRPQWHASQEWWEILSSTDHDAHGLRGAVGASVEGVWVVTYEQSDAQGAGFDAPVVVRMRSGMQVELCWTTRDVLSVTLDQIDLTAAPRVPWLPSSQAWAPLDPPSTLGASGRVVTGVALDFFEADPTDLGWENVADRLVLFLDGGGELVVANGPDSNVVSAGSVLRAGDTRLFLDPTR